MQLTKGLTYNLIFKQNLPVLGPGTDGARLRGILEFDDARKQEDVYSKFNDYAKENYIQLTNATFFKFELLNGDVVMLLEDIIDTATPATTYPITFKVFNMDNVKVDKLSILLKSNGYTFDILPV